MKVLAAAVVIQAVMYGGHFSFTVFFPSLLELAAGSRARVSSVYTLFTLVYLVFMFPVGLVADRASPRRLVAASALVYAIGFCLSGAVTSIAQLALTFGLVAGLGMSAGYIVPTASALRAFPERSGTAVGIASAGVALGSVIGPPVALRVITSAGWRLAFVALGTTVLAVVLVASLALRRAPSGGGGVRSAVTVAGRATPPGDGHAGGGGMETTPAMLAAGEILRAPHFWLLGVLGTANWLPILAMWTHLYPMALARGLASGRAAMAVSVFGAASLVGRLALGVLSDRWGRPLIIGVSLAGQVLAFGLLAALDDRRTLFVALALFGFASGGSISLLAVLATDLFGAASAGRIVGGTASVGAVVATLGPVAVGYLYDISGSYVSGFVLGAVLNVVALAVLRRLSLLGTYVPRTAPPGVVAR